VEQLKELRMNKNDFEVIKPLAKGQFGVVSIFESSEFIYAQCV
jgi:hypothetical protein